MRKCEICNKNPDDFGYGVCVECYKKEDKKEDYDIEIKMDIEDFPW